MGGGQCRDPETFLLLFPKNVGKREGNVFLVIIVIMHRMLAGWGTVCKRRDRVPMVKINKWLGIGVCVDTRLVETRVKNCNFGTLFC